MIKTREFLEFSRTYYSDLADHEHRRMQWHIDGMKEAQARYDAANAEIRSIDSKLRNIRRAA